MMIIIIIVVVVFAEHWLYLFVDKSIDIGVGIRQQHEQQ